MTCQMPGCRRIADQPYVSLHVKGPRWLCATDFAKLNALGADWRPAPQWVARGLARDLPAKVLA